MNLIKSSASFCSVRFAKLTAAIVCAAIGVHSGVSAQDMTASQGPTAADKQAHIRTVDAIAAIVNDEVITYQELNGRMQAVERRMRAQGAALPPPAELQKQLLERMILDRAQLQLAKEMGIRVDDATLDRAIARIAEQNKLSIAQLKQQLEQEGTSFARFREEIRDEIAMQRLREREVANKVQVTEAEVENFLSTNSGEAQGQQQEFNLAHILVRIPENASAGQIAQQRRRAEEALQQLRSGAEFEKVAAAYSDASDGLKGGQLGWRSKERLPEVFVGAATSLNQGEISPVIKSPNGFHIVKMLGKRTQSVVKAGDAAPAVQQTRARHILIKPDQLVSSAEARRKLVELKERLDNNAAKFEELAKLYSNDASAAKGGDLGWIYPGDTVPEFERAMNALQPGQISEPVESPFGYHLIQVLERKADVSQERQRLLARQTLRERKLDEATEEWLRQVRDRAYVEYRLPDGTVVPG